LRLEIAAWPLTPDAWPLPLLATLVAELGGRW